METSKRGCPKHGEAMQAKPAGAAYKCSGCEEMGFGSSYQCGNMDCNYILHENCANGVSHALHKFLPDSKFEFYEKPPGYPRYCDGCGKDVVGFVYHCIRTSHDLHPCCLNLNERISDEEGSVTLELCEKVPSKCVKCKRITVEKGIQGWSYVSSEGKYCYHVSCVKKLILEKWEKGYFSQETNPTMAESSQVADRNNGLEIVQSGAVSRRSRKMKKITKIAVLVFKLIVSAIFGNPVIAIAGLVEALFSG
ncbi:uncharacterized protein LOC106776845 [Vigna radiata var. radiata]|uniref:Uncharacterized protein LOC106776845 n=1 Tax=Vigna radiata var. radiata TaxID=3916 RepID=A0A1S3VN45_VIGRR|nr:uncharacterized protein LOC106776845 [Vigna radiata var. radiata]